MTHRERRNGIRCFLATRYHSQIPNQPFVVLTSHKNERYYLLVRDDQDDCFKVKTKVGVGVKNERAYSFR